MKHRIPKDIDKYITPWVAGIRLIDLAVKYIACRSKGQRVKWQLKLWVYYPEDFKTNAVALPMSGTFSSGDEVNEEQGSEEQ